ncbi:hypothetical protein DOTSEDRAFT_37989 [Dothistroma septosporum NZE10]|uniref:Uncharacterized protein n=1 Tax=Dothistroma septosporum (strain NZE10 / CBS 128990) TaxID=675120 RepID=N1PCG8_DOTSN|nr:hypothetical protein DOTSEDRAFT_37989 [Dothistroma septosporum NZE10]
MEDGVYVKEKEPCIGLLNFLDATKILTVTLKFTNLVSLFLDCPNPHRTRASNIKLNTNNTLDLPLRFRPPTFSSSCSSISETPRPIVQISVSSPQNAALALGRAWSLLNLLVALAGHLNHQLQLCDAIWNVQEVLQAHDPLSGKASDARAQPECDSEMNTMEQVRTEGGDMRSRLKWLQDQAAPNGLAVSPEIRQRADESTRRLSRERVLGHGNRIRCILKMSAYPATQSRA